MLHRKLERPAPPPRLHPRRRRRGKGGRPIVAHAGRVLTGRARAMPLRRAPEVRQDPGRAISASVVARGATGVSAAATTSGTDRVAVRRTTSGATASTASPSARCFPSKR